jgi:hypothetical protein
MSKVYTKSTYVNDSAPALNQTNLNNSENGIEINSRLDLAVIHNIATDADYTLRADYNQYGHITITDTGVVLTGGVNIIVNTDEHTYVFVNSTAQTLTVKTLAGTGIAVPAGEAKHLRNDTVNVIEFEGASTASTELFHAQQQEANGVSGGTSIAGTQTRVLNTIITNTITGASLSANQVTLPAGTYDFEGLVPGHSISTQRCEIFDTTGTTSYKGLNSRNVAGNVIEYASFKGRITFSVESVIELRHYTQSAGGSLGTDNGDVDSERYAEILIRKVG